jgi:uncharacterized protein
VRRRGFLALPFLLLPGAVTRGGVAAAPRAGTLQGDLLQAIEAIEAIDTHEHILPEQERTAAAADFFTLASHYALDDLTSAGLPADARALIERDDVPARKKWEVFAPWWTFVRTTGYGRALALAVDHIYGIDRIEASTLDTLNERIRARNRPGLYRDVLKTRARLRVCVNDEYWQPRPTRVDPEFFVLARKFDWFVAPITRAGVGRLEALAGRSITRLRDLRDAMASHVEAAVSLGLVTIKTTLAYERSLRFERVDEAEAARAFDALMRDASPPGDLLARLEARPYKPLADYLFHQLVQLAEAHRLPMQIHTGLHASNANLVTNSRPTDLLNLFVLYPRVTFDLFHVGYPFQHEAAVLAKTFPNVCIDFCWMYVVSPSIAMQTLHEVLDTVPLNKIMGFGGDYRYPELSYAHAVMARRAIAQVLAARVQQGITSERDALYQAQRLLHDNPAGLFLTRTSSAQARRTGEVPAPM